MKDYKLTYKIGPDNIEVITSSFHACNDRKKVLLATGYYKNGKFEIVPEK